MKRMPCDTDRQMILEPEQWPAWPFLPLKRKDHSLEDKNLGVLLCTLEHHAAIAGRTKFTVYHVYMYDPPKGKDAWAAAPKTEYSSVDELLKDGWVVD